MKKYFTLLLISAMAFGNYCLAQNEALQWIKTMGSSGNDGIQGMSNDVNNNLYVNLYLANSADIDPGPNTVLVANSSYIVKYNSNGNFIWYFDASTLSSAADKNGNVYVYGIYDSTHDFDPGAGVTKITSSFSDLCIAKYSTDANLLWVDDLKSADANTFSDNPKIVADNEGNCYITGFVGGEIDFDPSANKVLIGGNGNDNYFVAAYNATGGYKWAFKLDVNNTNYENSRIAVGKNGVYLFGVIPFDTTDIDPGSGIHKITGNSAGGNSYVAKYNKSNGSYIWGFGYANDTYFNRSKELAEDSLGNIIQSGFYYGPVDLDPGTGVSVVEGEGVYLAKYNSSGSFLWGKQESDFGVNYFDANAMAIDPQNNILRAGAHYNADSFNVAVKKYNSDGSEIWNFRLNHYGGHDFADGLVTDNLGNFYIAGAFDGTVDFDPNIGVLNETSVGGQDAFFGKYKDNTIILPVTLLNFSGETQGKQNLLHWTTATEQNNTGFEVQRSTDGNNFNKIGFENTKAVNGNSNSKLSYDFSDIGYAATNYYRLKQIDKDGKFFYSNIVVLKDENALANGSIKVYPNPVKNTLNIKIASINNSNITLSVTDISGKSILTKSALASNGETVIQLDVSHLSAGTYFLKSISADGSEKAVKKFVKE